MTKIVALFTLILLFITCTNNGNTKSEAISSDTSILLNPIDKDLDQIKKSGTLKVVTQYSQTSYFLYKGKTMGFEYELFKRIADSLGLKLEIIIAKDMNDYLYKLNSGEADVAAHALTITKNRQEIVVFTDYLILVKQVLVQKKPVNWRDVPLHTSENKLVRTCIDLIDQPVHIREFSSYNQRLLHLQNEMGGDIDIKYVNEDISTYNLISQVNSGKIKYTIADENIAMVSKSYMPNIDIKTKISCSQRIAWALRKNSPQLKIAIDKELKKLKHTADFNVLYNKYFKDKSELKYRSKSDELVTTKGGKLSKYDPIIKEVSKTYNIDWRLIASQIYQESKFNNNAKSWVGAEGLMQIMPSTAKELGIKDVKNPKENITKGMKYLQELNNYWLEIIPDSSEAYKFALASYNCGKGHVIDARAIADKFGKNQDIWFNETDRALLLLSEEKYYKMNFVKHGYCRGYEPVNYVLDIYDRYNRYKGFLK